MERVKEIEKIINAWKLAESANVPEIVGEGNIFDKIQGELADSLMSMAGEDGSDYQESSTYSLLNSSIPPKNFAEFIDKYGRREEDRKMESDLRDCINELCRKCGTYQGEYLGHCDGCRWKKEKDRLYGRA